MKKISAISIVGQSGTCGHLEVFLGFATAKVLLSASFADTLNEDTGVGYQRPYNRAHSLSFRQYIALPGSSTIPLTFNLRKSDSRFWHIERKRNGVAFLNLVNNKKCLAQVDCQHRLNALGDLDISLAFMTFIGLDLKQEMSLFNVINSKAKGLSSSLTDYHETKLVNDLAFAAPHLLLARRLNEDVNSPWFGLIRYGGETSSGLQRRTSLRMMQTSIRRLLRQMPNPISGDIDNYYLLICEYWRAIRSLYPGAWSDHRHHLLTKGVGLYSLMSILADVVIQKQSTNITEQEFLTILKPLQSDINWKSNGMFSHAGGRKGATEIYMHLKKVVLL